jgi:hypothetical protein
MPNGDLALKAATHAETNAVKDAPTDHAQCLPPKAPPAKSAAGEFKSFQLVAYRMPTFHPLAANAYHPDATSVVGRGLDPVAQALLQRFAAVLNYAKALPQIDADSATLKVFVAPEFYFKGPGVHWGSFSFNSMINMLDALKRIDMPGPDWLAIAGSIVFYLPEKLAGYKHADGSAVTPAESVYANVAPVLSASGITYVLKHYVSTVDGPDPSRGVSVSTVFQPLVESWTEQRARFIAVGNRVIGLEVCLDHVTNELATAIASYSTYEHRAPPPIDLHIITSCGMKIKNPQARNHGYAILCDGQGNGEDEGSQLSEVANKHCSHVKPTRIVALPTALTAAATQRSPKQSIAVYSSRLLP